MGNSSPPEWAVAAALHLYRRLAIPPPVAATCLSLTTITGILGALLAAVLFGGLGNPGFGGPWPLLGLSAALITASTPRLLYPSLNWVLKLVGRPPIEVRLRATHIVAVVLALALAAGLYGAGFGCLTYAFVPTAPAGIGQLIGLFAFAQIAGFLAFFAPAGIGVREGVLMVGLSPLVGSGPAIVVAAACRLWQTAMELAMTLVGLAMLRSLRLAPGRFPSQENPSPQPSD